MLKMLNEGNDLVKMTFTGNNDFYINVIVVGKDLVKMTFTGKNNFYINVMIVIGNDL